MKCVLFTRTFSGHRAKYPISKVKLGRGWLFQLAALHEKQSISVSDTHILLLLWYESILWRVKREVKYLRNNFWVRKRIWCWDLFYPKEQNKERQFISNLSPLECRQKLLTYKNLLLDWDVSLTVWNGTRKKHLGNQWIQRDYLKVMWLKCLVSSAN